MYKDSSRKNCEEQRELKLSLYRVLKCDITNIWIIEIMGSIKIVRKEHDEKMPTC